MEFTEPQSLAIRLVDNQLATLQLNWGTGARPEAVYSMAALLRDLLVHGSFARAWGLIWAPGERSKITVVAPDLAALVPEDQRHRVVYAQTAGFARPGMHLWMPVALTGTETFTPPGAPLTENPGSRTNLDKTAHVTSKSSAEEVENRQMGTRIAGVTSMSMRLKGAIMSGLIDQDRVPLAPHSCYRRYTLKQFLLSPCLIYQGREFTRKAVVASFANNLGSAHIDWDGKSPEYEMLTNNEWLSITDRNPALYEVLSIGQIISRSASAIRFRSRVAELGLDPLR